MKSVTYSIRFIIIFFLFIIVNSCSGEDNLPEDREFQGNIDEIKQIVGEDLFNILIEQGFTFNSGNTPPLIEGIYLGNTLKVQSSTVTYDPRLGTYIDKVSFLFQNQNNEKLTIDFKGEGTDQQDAGEGAILVGEGNNFSLILDVESILDDQYLYTSLFALSGTITDNGITNFKLGVFVKDDHDAPDGVYLPENNGRVFIETDGLVERTD